MVVFGWKCLPNVYSFFRCKYTPTFTEEEDQKFAERLEEGYDLTIDARYNLWLETYYPSRAHTCTDVSENQDQAHGTVCTHVRDCTLYFMSI